MPIFARHTERPSSNSARVMAYSRPRAVQGEDVDDRVAVRGAVVGVDVGLRAGGGRRFAAADCQVRRNDGRLRPAAAQRLLQRRSDLGQPLRRRLAGKIRIVDPEAVQHQPVGQGVDLGRADLQALAGQGPGQLVEDAAA